MGEVSHNTEKLQDLAKELENFDAEQVVTDKIGDCGLPFPMWPITAWGSSAPAYSDLHNFAHETSVALSEFTTALGESVRSVAEYYRSMEEEYGKDFEAVDESD